MPGSWSVPVSEQMKRDSFFRQVHLKFALRYFIPWQNMAIIRLHQRAASYTAGASRPREESYPLPPVLSNDSIGHTTWGPMLSSTSPGDHSLSLTPHHERVHSAASSAAMAAHVDQASADAERGIEALLQAGERIHQLEREIDVLKRENRQHAEANNELVDAVAEIELHTVASTEETSRARVEQVWAFTLMHIVRGQLSDAYKLFHQTAVAPAAAPLQRERHLLPSSAPHILVSGVDEEAAQPPRRSTMDGPPSIATVPNMIIDQLMYHEDHVRSLLVSWCGVELLALQRQCFDRTESVARQKLEGCAMKELGVAVTGAIDGKRALEWELAIAAREVLARHRAQKHLEQEHSSKLEGYEDEATRAKRELTTERQANAAQRDSYERQIAYFKAQVAETEKSSMKREQLMAEQLNDATKKQHALANDLSAALEKQRELQQRIHVESGKTEIANASPLLSLWQTVLLDTEAHGRLALLEFEAEEFYRTFTLEGAVIGAEALHRKGILQAEAYQRTIDCTQFLEFMEAQWRSFMFRIYKKFVMSATERFQELDQTIADCTERQRLLRMPSLGSRYIERVEATERIEMEEEASRQYLRFEEAVAIGECSLLHTIAAQAVLQEAYSNGASRLRFVEHYALQELLYNAAKDKLQMREVLQRDGVVAEERIEWLQILDEGVILVETFVTEVEEEDRLHIVTDYILDTMAIERMESEEVAYCHARVEYLAWKATRDDVFAQFRFVVNEDSDRQAVVSIEADERQQLHVIRTMMDGMLYTAKQLLQDEVDRHMYAVRQAKQRAALSLLQSTERGKLAVAFQQWDAFIVTRRSEKRRRDVAFSVILRGGEASMQRTYFRTWEAAIVKQRERKHKLAAATNILRTTEHGLLRTFYRLWRKRLGLTQAYRKKLRNAEFVLQRTQRGMTSVYFRHWRLVTATNAEAARHRESSRVAAFNLAVQFSEKSRLRSYYSVWIRYHHMRQLQKEQAAREKAAEEHGLAFVTQEQYLELMAQSYQTMWQCGEAEQAERALVAEEEAVVWGCSLQEHTFVQIEDDCRQQLMETQAADAAFIEALMAEDEEAHHLSGANRHRDRALHAARDESQLDGLLVGEELLWIGERDGRQMIRDTEDLLWDALCTDAFTNRQLMCLTEEDVQRNLLENTCWDVLCALAAAAIGHRCFLLAVDEPRHTQTKRSVVSKSLYSLATLDKLCLTEEASRAVLMHAEQEEFAITARSVLGLFHNALEETSRRDPSLVRVHAQIDDHSPNSLAGSPQRVASSSAAAIVDTSASLLLWSADRAAGRPCYGLYLSNTLAHGSTPGVYVVSTAGHASHLLREGDFILAINGTHIDSITEAMDAIPFRNHVLTRPDVDSGAADIELSVLRCVESHHDGVQQQSEVYRLSFRVPPVLEADFPSVRFAALL